MNRKEFANTVARVLRENNIRKAVSIPKQVFHISDDEGNSKDFTIKKVDKTVMFTAPDIDAILEACLYVAQEALKRGEPITFKNFGTLALNYRKPRSTKSLDTGEEIYIEGHYIPKFTFSDALRICGKVYELSLKDDPGELVYECDTSGLGGVDNGD